ncbi:hypothetical protein L798_15161 [Zootermopsis nevadensis]|uniref:Uncharacterized protein n=1 Tax=Zootermopsis nevadensis TaxID=136037 RepID=A0A067QVZ8_ZOONE|nr:hypothetical protein L798_15161 [Zootermopsis nevadensis]
MKMTKLHGIATSSSTPSIQHPTHHVLPAIYKGSKIYPTHSP